MKRLPRTAVLSLSVFSVLVALILPSGVLGQEPSDESAVAGTNEDAQTRESAPPDAEEMIRQFKERAPDEVRESGLLAMEKFVTTSKEFQRTVIEMRKQHTLFANGYSDDRKAYLDLRDRSRDLMNQAYTEALYLLNYFPHPAAARFIVTVLEYRERLWRDPPSCWIWACVCSMSPRRRRERR